MINWEAFGAIAEFVGAGAVLITLIYLTIQLKHGRTLLDESRRIALSQVHNARSRSMRDLHKLAMEQELSDVLGKVGLSRGMRGFCE